MLRVALILVASVLCAGAGVQEPITARQREIVREAASPYRGRPVQIIVERSTPAGEAFARSFTDTLASAGMDVTMRAIDHQVTGCPPRPGVRVIYGPGRSGAVNAIAEALIRSGVLSESVAGCPVPEENALTFIVWMPQTQQ